MADAIPYVLGFVVGVVTYRCCIGRVARSRELDVTNRQLWSQTLALAALPLAIALAIAWRIFE